MNEPSVEQPQNAIDVLRLARAIRFALVCLVLGLSYFSIRGSLAIHNFGLIFHDMLGNRPLPPLTVLVLGLRDEFVVVSILVPALAIWSLFSRHVERSFYIIGSLGIITLVQFILLYHGLAAPLGVIIESLGGGESGR